MCSSARFALLSSTVRGPHPYSTAGIPRSQNKRASVYSGVPEASIASPNTADACRVKASTSGVLPGSGFNACANKMRLISTVAPGDPATAAWITRCKLASTSAGFSSGIIRRSSLSTTLPGTTLVLVPPWISPTFRYGCLMPLTVLVICWLSTFWWYSAFSTLVAACSASMAVSGTAAWPALPFTVTSICRQPLWPVTTW